MSEHIKTPLSLMLAVAAVAVAAWTHAQSLPAHAEYDEWGQPITPLPTAITAELDRTEVASGVINLDALPLPPEQPVRVAGLVTQSTAAPAELPPAAPTPSGMPPGTRPGMFQKAFFNAAWIPATTGEADDLGLGQLEAGVVLGFPFLRRDTPLLVTPTFASFLLDNADALDIPDTLYEAAVDFNHLRKLGDGPWGINVGVTVGYYSDFDRSSAEATRVTGRGFVAYESSPAAKWIVGVVYLNRAGASVLPAVGLIYTPTDDVRWDVLFPRPRVSWRLAGSTEMDSRWWFVGGEFGGGAWSITHPSNGELDFLNYRDLRVLAGYERKIIGGLSRTFEVGYLFARELEFDSALPDVALDDSLFVRAGLKY